MARRKIRPIWLDRESVTDIDALWAHLKRMADKCDAEDEADALRELDGILDPSCIRRLWAAARAREARKQAQNAPNVVPLVPTPPQEPAQPAISESRGVLIDWAFPNANWRAAHPDHVYVAPHPAPESETEVVFDYNPFSGGAA